MNFYEASVEFKQLKTKEENETRSLFAGPDEKNPKNYIRDAFEGVNRNLGVKCDEQEAFSIFFWNAEKGKANVIFSVDMEVANTEDAVFFLKTYMEENYDITAFSVNDIKEITTERFRQLGDRGDNNGLIRRFRGEECDMGLDFRNNNQYQIRETLIPEENISLEEAITTAKEFMADDSFVEELERIYSDENEKRYYGNPVHYKISASNIDSAMKMATLLASALKVNKRLEGSRINKVYEIKEGCYNEDDFKNMFEKAQGNVVLFDLSGSNEDHGNYAGAYEEVIEYLSSIICKHHVKTLCIFVENTNHPGFAKKLLASVAEDIDIIELKEGCGSKEATIDYIESLARSNKFELSRAEIEDIMPDKSLFTVGEAYEIYNKWFKNGLRNAI